MWDEITYPFPNLTRYKHIHNRQTSDIIRTLLDNRYSSVIACPLCSNYRYIFILDDRPHSRQVTGARYTEVAARQSSILLKASNGQQVSGWTIKDFPVLSEMRCICEQPLYGIILMILPINKSSV